MTQAEPAAVPDLRLVQKRENLKNWDTDNEVLSLLDVVRNVEAGIF